MYTCELGRQATKTTWAAEPRLPVITPPGIHLVGEPWPAKERRRVFTFDKRGQTDAVLAQRELEIVRNVVAGLPNKEIGKKLFISEGTVKVHLHSIYEKLKVDSCL